jgi:zinc/manganese transport system ATP-binding protein
MSVLENIAYPLKVRHVSKERREEVATTTGASLQIGELMQRRPGELSGGQQQRVALARAIASRPQVFLLDEPLSNLDVRNRASIVQLLDDVRRQRGLTVVLVAHDVNPLLPYIDRVVYLAGGHAVEGPVEEVITSETLSTLHGLPVEVLRASDGRLVVVGQPEAPAHHHDRHAHMQAHDHSHAHAG